MATVLISHKVVDAAGIPIAGCPVVIELQPIQGFRLSDGASVGRRYSTVTDGSGDMAVALERNDDIFPQGTYYVATFSAPSERGGPQKYRFTATAAQSLFASLIDPPTFPDTVFVANLTEAYLDTRYERIYRGNGDPEGVVSGVIGDVWKRTNGTPDNTLYVKESGAPGTSSGWRALKRPFFVICTSTTRPADPYEGQPIYETNRKAAAIYQGGGWRYMDTVKCTAATRPTGADLYEGLEIYEEDTDRKYVYNGAAWRYLLGGNNPTAARARVNAVTSLANAAFTKVNFQVEDYDYGNNFANSEYTAPEPSVFAVKSTVCIANANAVQRLVASIFVNGALHAQGTDLTQRSGGVGDAVSSTINDDVALSQGDVVSIRAFQQNGSAVSVNTEVAGVQSFFSIKRA